MTAQKSRRKNYFIKKKFQANFFGKFAWLLLTETMLICVLFMYISRGTLTAAYRGADFTIQRTGQYFFTDFVIIVLILGAVIAVMGILILMFLSHRIGGALYRFEQTMEEARGGNFAQRVRLRHTDELHDLNSRFNLFLETLDLRVADMKREADRGLAAAREAKGNEAAEKAAEALKNIQAALERFKTSR